MFDHRLTIHRYNRGNSAVFGRPSYGSRACCSCGAFELRRNEAPSRALSTLRAAWFEHLRLTIEAWATESGMGWSERSGKARFICDIHSHEGVPCSRKAQWRFGQFMHAARVMACTQHAKLLGVDTAKVDT